MSQQVMLCRRCDLVLLVQSFFFSISLLSILYLIYFLRFSLKISFSLCLPQKPSLLTPPPVVTLKKKKSLGSPMNPFSIKPQMPKVSFNLYPLIIMLKNISNTLDIFVDHITGLVIHFKISNFKVLYVTSVIPGVTLGYGVKG